MLFAQRSYLLISRIRSLFVKQHCVGLKELCPKWMSNRSIDTRRMHRNGNAVETRDDCLTKFAGSLAWPPCVASGHSLAGRLFYKCFVCASNVERHSEIWIQWTVLNFYYAAYEPTHRNGFSRQLNVSHTTVRFHSRNESKHSSRSVLWYFSQISSMYTIFLCFVANECAIVYMQI